MLSYTWVCLIKIGQELLRFLLMGKDLPSLTCHKIEMYFLTIYFQGMSKQSPQGTVPYLKFKPCLINGS
jgi:hypothetical protein